MAIDFQHDDLATVLAGHGYNRAQRTFFILEGVTMYLPEEAARSTLQFVAGHPPGSGIVFDFVYRTLIDMIAGIDLNNVPAAAKPFVERFMSLNAQRALGVRPAGRRRARVPGRARSRIARAVDRRRRRLGRALSHQGGRQPGGGEAIAAARARMANWLPGRPAGAQRLADAGGTAAAAAAEGLPARQQSSPETAERRAVMSEADRVGRSRIALAAAATTM